MLSESTEIVDEYWASDFGCERVHLRPRAPRLQQHSGRLSAYSGAFILVVDAAPLVSIPSALLSAVTPRATQFVAEAIQDADALRRLLVPGTVTKIIGPALLNYADRSCVALSGTENTRELGPQDDAAFQALRAACPPEEWEPKDFSPGSQPTFGAFATDGALVAISDMEVWADRIAHISVVTNPAFRGRGFGTRAVAAAIDRALDSGLLPQYRVLEDNVSSRSVARKLGFQSYGWTLAARLAQT